MPYTDDEFATIIQDAVRETAPAVQYGRPARQAHPVLSFAAGLGLFLLDAIFLWALVWLLRHA